MSSTHWADRDAAMKPHRITRGQDWGHSQRRNRSFVPLQTPSALAPSGPTSVESTPGTPIDTVRPEAPRVVLVEIGKAAKAPQESFSTPPPPPQATNPEPHLIRQEPINRSTLTSMNCRPREPCWATGISVNGSIDADFAFSSLGGSSCPSTPLLMPPGDECILDLDLDRATRTGVDARVGPGIVPGIKGAALSLPTPAPPPATDTAVLAPPCATPDPEFTPEPDTLDGFPPELEASPPTAEPGPRDLTPPPPPLLLPPPAVARMAAIVSEDEDAPPSLMRLT